MRRRRRDPRERRQQLLYGWSPGEWRHLLKALDYRCLVCGDPLKEGRGGMATDHDHRAALRRQRGTSVTFDGGPIRGILCMPCNTLAGQAKDDPRPLLQQFHATGTLRYLWLARFLVHTDAADEWVPTKIPLVRDLPPEAGQFAVTWRHIGSVWD